MSDPTPEALAQRFHETYERLAPDFGYETRKESARPWSEVPEQNRRLMIAVCGEILSSLRLTEVPSNPESGSVVLAVDPSWSTPKSSPVFVSPIEDSSSAPDRGWKK